MNMISKFLLGKKLEKSSLILKYLVLIFMAMYMGNRILILSLIILFNSCDNFQKKEEINCNSYSETIIYFKGFQDYKINKISVIDFKESTNNCDYINPEFDNTDESGLMRLSINSLTTQSLANGCMLIINDNQKYKITDIKSVRIEHTVGFIWAKKIWECKLKEYRLNDSLIKNCEGITIYK